jgi:HlyD family secretion protein
MSQIKRTAAFFKARKVIGGLAIGLSAVALGGMLIGASQGRESAPASTASNSSPRTSDLFEVARSAFDITTTAMGELRARNQIEIRNRLEAETSIVEIIPEGTTVSKGDVLIKLNSETIRTRIEEESLMLETARAQLVEAEEAYAIQVSENESALRAAKLKVDLATLDLEKWKSGEVESKRQTLEHALDRAIKDAERLADKYKKSQPLFDKGYYSKDQLQQDQLNLDQAQAALEKARLDKKVYWDFEHPKDKRQKESDVEQAKADALRTERQNVSKLASKEADRNNKRQALAIRQQKYQKYEQQLEAATIKAPQDGLVVYSTSMESGMRWGGDDGPLQVGTKVFPNQLLIALPDTSEMIAAVKVHESLAGRIRPGQTAVVKVDAAGGERFRGTIESIGILAEQTNRWMDPNLREYTVRISLDVPTLSDSVPTKVAESDGAPSVKLASDTGKDTPAESAANEAKPKDIKRPRSGNAAGLKPSMRAEAEVQLGRVDDAITVPIQAVFSDGLVRYVHVKTGNQYSKRPVLVGQRSDRFAEIRAGLTPGELVLLRKPDAGEVLAGPWQDGQLAAVGLKTNDQGQVVPVAGEAASPMGMPVRRPSVPPAAAPSASVAPVKSAPKSAS